MAGDTKGYASYKVAEHVQSHQAWGMGIYSFFGVHQKTNSDVRLKSAIESPDTKNVRITHITTFAGRSGGIDYPINFLGEATNVGELKLFEGVNADE
jgi:hypothetical protein